MLRVFAVVGALAASQVSAQPVAAVEPPRTAPLDVAVSVQAMAGVPLVGLTASLGGRSWQVEAGGGAAFMGLGLLMVTVRGGPVWRTDAGPFKGPGITAGFGLMPVFFLYGLTTGGTAYGGNQSPRFGLDAVLLADFRATAHLGWTGELSVGGYLEFGTPLPVRPMVQLSTGPRISF